MVVVVYAGRNFANYKSGIYYNFFCPFMCSASNHAVLLVGE
jgi:hypothetical protein